MFAEAEAPNSHRLSPLGELFCRTDTLELAHDELGNLLRAFVSDGSDGSDGQDATTIDYLVDGFGRRIVKRVGGQFSRAWL